MRKKNFLVSSMSLMLFGFISLLSSCVQGDLCELYDEDLSASNMIPRNKKTKEVSGDACGVCSIADVMFGNTDYYAVNNVYAAAKKCGITNFSSPLWSSQMEAILDTLDTSSHDWNCVSINLKDNYGNKYVDNGPLISTLTTTSGKVIVVIKGTQHFLVGTERSASKLKVHDPQNGGDSDWISFSEFEGAIY